METKYMLKRGAVAVALLCCCLGASAAPLAGDVDRNGVINAVDVQQVINGVLGYATEYDVDMDRDGALSAVEVQLVVNACLGIQIDMDSDGLSDAGEANLGTDATVPDTDNDGVVDGQEILDQTDPLDWTDYRRLKPTLNAQYLPVDISVVPNAPGPALPLNLEEVTNFDWINKRIGLENAVPSLVENGFAMIEWDLAAERGPKEENDKIISPYIYCVDAGIPIFITSDSLLHVFHVLFDDTLKDVEENEFVDSLSGLTNALLSAALDQYRTYTGDFKEAAWRNTQYLHVAKTLIENDEPPWPVVADDVSNELSLIMAHEGFGRSPIFHYQEDYSQYAPRGHYPDSNELSRYFRTMMWYGRMAFLLNSGTPYDARIQTLQAVLLSQSLENVEVGDLTGMEVWNRIYAVTAFYVGMADDLTPKEYIEAVARVSESMISFTDLVEPDNFFKLKCELALMRSPAIYGGTGNIQLELPITPESLNEVLDKTKGMRFMGQRFIPDSYVFQRLVLPSVSKYTGSRVPMPFSAGRTQMGVMRSYPRGLDFMAVCGSTLAESILVEEGDTEFVNYPERFEELRAEFAEFDVSDWGQNLYWAWLYSLQALVEPFPEGYPNFMRTEAWQKKELNTALASWAELRHDTILYAKQSYGVSTTSPPQRPGSYVEPVPEFYGRLLALTRFAREGLDEFGVLPDVTREKFEEVEEILERLLEIAIKELTGLPLTQDDRIFIDYLAYRLQPLATSPQEDDESTTIMVADVHTNPDEGLVVEEGVGYVDYVVVACPGSDGRPFLAVGPVLSYYEFKHPMSDRLTDEAWGEMLKSSPPQRPPWYEALISAASTD